MNNKILSVVLVAGIAVTGFAGITAANSDSIFSGEKSEIRELMQKSRSGEELTADEQSTLETAKAEMGDKKSKFGKRKGLKNLTDEEKTALESMSDEEKQVFFDAKKEEMMAQKEAGKAVIDKLVAGETLSAAEEATRLEMLAKFEDNTGKKHKGSDVIVKVLAGDALTDAEQTELAEMKVKHEEREAAHALLEPIKAKLDAGEELTDEEQALLDEYKSEKKGKKGHGRGSHEKGQRGER